MSMGPTQSTFVGGNPERRVLRKVMAPSQAEVKTPAATLPKSATVYQERPLAPMFSIKDPIPQSPGPEPAPWTANAEGWATWIAKDNVHRTYEKLMIERDRADAYALENDLRGTPFS